MNYTGANELPQDKIVLHEIMYHPLFASASYVEIYNTSLSNAFDLSGWKLNGAGFTFPSGAIIEPGAYKLIVEDNYIFAATYGPSAAVIGQFGGKLDNGGETLTLLKPGATAAEDLVIDQVTYDDDLPWPAGANGGGYSLQLMDPSRDNNRVANWAGGNPITWRYVTLTSTATSSRLYIYLSAAGDAYVDDLKLVSGAMAEQGANLIANGDFESAFTGPWTTLPNYTNSTISTTAKHSGSGSLHVIGNAGGSGNAAA